MTDVIPAGGGRVLALPGRSAVELVSGAEGGYDVTVRRVAIPPEDGSGPPAPAPARRVPGGHADRLGGGRVHYAVPDLAGGTGDVIVVSPGELHLTRNHGPGDLVSLCFFPVPDLAAVTSEPASESGGGLR